MNRLATVSLLVGGALSLSACGGGGGGGGGLEAFASRYAALGADPTLASMTADATVDARNSSASYAGIINIGTDAASNPAGAAAYYGDVNMTVNFTNASTSDAMSGSAGNFVQYFSEIASSKTGQGVSGSLTLSGNLTGTNTTLGNGLSGTASGSIDGIDVAYTYDGNINGVGANGMSLYFDGANADSSGGVALLVE